MKKLGQKGIAAMAVAAAVLAVSGSAVGAPIVVDEMDVNPTHPLYGLERAGERIKEATYAGGQEWNLERAQERIQEFSAVKKKDVSSNHEGLLNESEECLRNGIGMSKDIEGLERAKNAVEKHVRVLENVENKVPEEAKSAVQRAMVRSRAQSKALQEVKENIRGRFGQGELPPGLLKQELENKLKSVDNVVETLQDKELPPGIFKEVVENRGVPSDNLMDLVENRRLSPGVVKEILENREISLDEIQDFLEERDLPRGIVKEILEDKGVSGENIEEFLDELDVIGKPENVGRPENAGPPANPGPPGEDESKDEDQLDNEEREEDENRPENAGMPKNFVHQKGNVPPWIPGPPSWAGPGGKPGETPGSVPDEGKEETGGDEEITEETGYELLDGVRIQNPPAFYTVNPSNGEEIEENVVLTEITMAFETWDNHTSVELFDDSVGPTTESGFEQDGENVVSFAPLDESNTVGKTKIWHSEEGKNVLEFDIVLNSNVEWGVDPDESAYDIRNIMTHEAGHSLVLLDIDDKDYGHLTMYHLSEPGSTVKRTLENGDIAGLHELYGR